MNEYSVVVVDDHPLFREGLVHLLQTFDNIRVVGQASDGLEAIDVAREKQPDLLILDVAMPRMKGTQALPKIIEAAPDTRVLVLSMYDEEEYIHDVFKHGASGYLLKKAAAEELENAIATVLKGHIYLSPEISRMIVLGWIARSEDRKDSKDALTDREEEVLKLIVEGYTNKQVAEMLHISVKTVETHRHRIMKKLNLSTYAELVKYALKAKLIE